MILAVPAMMLPFLDSLYFHSWSLNLTNLQTYLEEKQIEVSSCKTYVPNSKDRKREAVCPVSMELF